MEPFNCVIMYLAVRRWVVPVGRSVSVERPVSVTIRGTCHDPLLHPDNAGPGLSVRCRGSSGLALQAAPLVQAFFLLLPMVPVGKG